MMAMRMLTPVLTPVLTRALLLLVLPAPAPMVPARAQTTARAVSDGTIGYAMTQVRGKRIRFPRLTRYRDTTIMRRVNRELDAFTREFGCEKTNRDSYYDVRSAVTYAASDIFSIYASEEYYCGTAYPTNDANNSMTFDLRTGKRVTFEGLFANHTRDSRRILRTIFAKQIANSERLVAANTQGDECDTDPEMFSLAHLESSSFAFHLGANGLVVQPEWPHVIEACAELVTVPYARIRQFAASGGVLARAAAGAAIMRMAPGKPPEPAARRAR